MLHLLQLLVNRSFLARYLLRNYYLQSDNMLSLLRGTSQKESIIWKFYLITELRSCVYIYLFFFIVNCCDCFLAAQYGIYWRNLQLCLNVVSISNKGFMPSYRNFYQKIAFEITLFTEFKCLSITNSLWKHYLLFYIFVLDTWSLASRTKLFYFHSLSHTCVASGVHYKHSLTQCLSTTSVTRMTFYWGCPRLAFCSFTILASYLLWVFNRLY